MGAPVGRSEARLPMVTDRNSAPFRARDGDAKCPVVQPGWAPAPCCALVWGISRHGDASPCQRAGITGSRHP